MYDELVALLGERAVAFIEPTLNGSSQIDAPSFQGHFMGLCRACRGILSDGSGVGVGYLSAVVDYPVMPPCRNWTARAVWTHSTDKRSRERLARADMTHGRMNVSTGAIRCGQ